MRGLLALNVAAKSNADLGAAGTVARCGFLVEAPGEFRVDPCVDVLALLGFRSHEPRVRLGLAASCNAKTGGPHSMISGLSSTIGRIALYRADPSSSGRKVSSVISSYAFRGQTHTTSPGMVLSGTNLETCFR